MFRVTYVGDTLSQMRSVDMHFFLMALIQNVKKHTVIFSNKDTSYEFSHYPGFKYLDYNFLYGSE